MLFPWAHFDEVGVAVAHSTEGQIRALADAGVKHVLWGDLFDVAQAPAVVTRSRIGGALAPTYLAEMTKAVRAHNTEMEAAIVRLKDAHPELTLKKLDVFGKFAELLAEPEQYGIADAKVGANDNKHLFSADGLHPTNLGHRLRAEYAFAVLTGKTEAKSASAP